MNNVVGSRLERAASIVLSVAAISMAGAVVYREFVPRGPRPLANSATQEGAYIPDWQALRPFARYIGDSVAPVLLIEFADLECPACRGFHESTLPDLRQSVRTSFSVALVHLPLSSHRFAKAAAHAAECAAEQGRFGRFVERVMDKQDSVGLKSWVSFARDAHVVDLDKFAECTGRPGTPPFVDSGMVAARRLGISGTPTVLVNGWRVGTTSAAEIARVVNEVSANRSPYPRRAAKTQQQ
jgi:hypothetical protein